MMTNTEATGTAQATAAGEPPKPAKKSGGTKRARHVAPAKGKAKKAPAKATRRARPQKSAKEERTNKKAEVIAMSDSSGVAAVDLKPRLLQMPQPS